jgi:hypothetical protein
MIPEEHIFKLEHFVIADSKDFSWTYLLILSG